MKKLYLSIIGTFLSITSVCAQKIEGKVFDKDTNTPIAEGEVTFYNNDGGRVATVYTQKDGEYSYEPNDLSMIHKVVGSADNYNKAEVLVNQMEFGIVANFGLVNDKNQSKSNNTKDGESTDLKKSNLPFFYFDFNSSYLSDSNKLVVNQIVDFMKNNPDSKVRVHVYFDTRGNAKYDEWMADRRASRVIDYLIMKGISQNRLVKWVETVSSNIQGRVEGTTQSSRNEARRCDFEVM